MAHKKLMDLPPEIQETIYLYSHNDHLDVVNKTFNTLSHSYRLIAQKLLLKYSIQNPNIPNEKWINLIQDRQFNSDIAKALFNLGYNTKEMTEIMIEYSTTRGDLKLLTFILDDWRNLGVENLQVIKNRALIQCSIFGHVDLMQLLLQRGAEVNYDHDASISMAAKYGKTKAARLLIDSGCDIHVDEEYPLCWASRGGYLEVVRMLLDAGADATQRRSCSLHWAAEQGHGKVVELLLERNAEINSNDSHALRWGTVHGHLHIVKLLLEKGANIHAGNNYSLRNAVKMRHLEIVKVLLENGADPTAEDSEAIKWALTNNDTELTDLLARFQKEFIRVHTRPIFYNLEE